MIKKRHKLVSNFKSVKHKTSIKMYIISPWHTALLDSERTSSLWRCPLWKEAWSSRQTGESILMGPTTAPQGYTGGKTSASVTGWSQSARPCNHAPSPGHSPHHTAGKTERERNHLLSLCLLRMGTAFSSEIRYHSSKEESHSQVLIKQVWKPKREISCPYWICYHICKVGI